MGEREQSTRSLDDAEIENLARQLEVLPDEALTRLQYFHPQVGCFNRCAFCCQEAGRDLWQFTRRGQHLFITALGRVARRRGTTEGPLVGGDRMNHRPGVMFPYFDNDVASYPYLYDFIDDVVRELGARVRLATIGYSSRNPELVAMHRAIVRDFAEHLVAIRFSFTPYTRGWTSVSENAGDTTRQQFIADFGGMLSDYSPLFEHIGANKENGLCVEMRFPPLVVTGTPVHEGQVGDRFVIAVGPHVLVSARPSGARPRSCRLLRVIDGRPFFSNRGDPYLHARDDSFAEGDAWRDAAEQVIRGDIAATPVRAATFENSDGEYIAASWDFLPTGEFRALHVYPRTASRRACGYTDATRHFLNSIIAWKRSKGLDRRGTVPDATWADIEEVIDVMRRTAADLSGTDGVASRHLRDDVIPLVEGYAQALQVGSIPLHRFFDPDFTIDTGQIVNQGRAKSLFKGLLGENDDPSTPREERGFGRRSFSSDRGYIWRITPVPFGEGADSPGRRGGKNISTAEMTVEVHEMDPRHLRPIDRETGAPLRTFYIHGVELEHVTLEEGRESLAYPGIAPRDDGVVAEPGRVGVAIGARGG